MGAGLESRDMTLAEERAPALRDYIDVVRRRSRTVLAVVVVLVAAAIVYSLVEPPVYRATATVLVEPVTSDQDAPLPPLNLETESTVATSAAVVGLAAARLEDAPPDLVRGLQVDPEPGTEVLAFRYTTTDRRVAAEAANAFADAYLEFRRARLARSFERLAEPLRRQLQEVTAEIAATGRKLQRARRQRDTDLVGALETQRAALLFRIGALQERLAEVDPAQAAKVEPGQVLEEASEPTTPYAPNLELNIALALAGGLLLGLVLAFLQDYLARPAS